MKPWFVLVLILVIFNFVVKSASAQYEQIQNAVCTLMGATDISYCIQWFLSFPFIIYNLFLPLIAIFAATLGLMREIKIFESSRNIQNTLAAVMAFSTIPTHALYLIVAVMLAINAYLSIFVFLGLFFIGGLGYFWEGLRKTQIRWTSANLYKSYKEGSDRLLQEIDAFRAKIAQLEEEADRESTPDGRKGDIAREIQGLKTKIRNREERLSERKQNWENW